jgi:hypothetical protein
VNARIQKRRFDAKRFYCAAAWALQVRRAVSVGAL